MIQIDYVENVSRPQTKRLGIVQFEMMLDSWETAFLIAETRTGKSEQKRSLPGICWQAVFEPQLRREANARPNGLFALDIDHIGWEAVDHLWQHTQPRLDELDIVCFHRSPSGDGARIVALCQPQFQTIAENQLWLAQRLGTPFDAACHDLARLFFISQRRDFYYIDYETLFKP